MSWLTIARRVIWQRTAPYWLFWWTFIYMWIAMYSVFIAPVTDIEYIQMAWILMCSLPLWISPVARFLNTRVIWK